MSAAPAPPPLPLDRPPKPRWRWALLLLIIAPLPILVGVAGLSRAETNMPALTHGAGGLLLVCALEVAAFVAIYGLAWLAARPSADQLFLCWRPGYWVIPLGLGYSVAIRLIVGLVVAGLLMAAVILRFIPADHFEQFVSEHRPKFETLVDVQEMKSNSAYYWLTVTLVSFVVGGLREELWRGAFLGGMRGLWPRTFASRGRQIAAAGLAAIFFGLGHLPQGPLAAGMIGLIGFTLGVITVVHRSIWPAVIAHGAFDATTMAILPMAAEKLKMLHGN